MKIVFNILFCLVVLQTHSQTYSLQQCIDSALANNLSVKRVQLQTKVAEVDWKQSRSNLLPNLNADLSQGYYSGRSIDPSTNAFVNQKYNGGTYGINSGVTLFNGLALQNRIRENAFAHEASKMEYQQAKDELILEVILAYLSVLSNEDQLTQTYQQASTTQATLDRLNILHEQGAVRPSDVSDLKGQYMNDQLNILEAKNIVESSKLVLAQLMNRNYDSAMKLERANLEEFLTAYGASANEVFQTALDKFSQVKAAELRTQSTVYSIKAAKGNLYPRLSLGAGINTRYSSLAENAGVKMPYTDQLKNFKNSYIGLGLTVPIFNNFYTRNTVKLADIALQDNRLLESTTKRQLRQQIDRSYLNMTNAYNRYRVLLDQVNAYNDSYKAAEVRFKAGVGTSVDYLIAKDRLDGANINLINAKYDFVLRKKILDYYSGKMEEVR